MSDCDADFAVAVNAFASCSTIDECQTSYESSLRLISPVDFDVVTQSVEEVLFCSVNDQSCLRPDLVMDVFLAATNYSRMLASVAQAVDRLQSWQVKHDFLDSLCGNEWAMQNCDADGCAPRNATCAAELATMDRWIWFVRLRVFHALRRELRFCEAVVCRSSSCSNFIGAIMANLNARRRAFEPKGSEAELRVGLISDTVLAWHRRNCSSGDLPCPKKQIEPLLNLTNDDLESARLAVTIVETIPVVPSADFEARFWRLLDSPFPTCNSFFQSDKYLQGKRQSRSNQTIEAFLNLFQKGSDFCIEDQKTRANVTAFLDKNSFMDRMSVAMRKSLLGRYSI